jgi:pyruvate,water dikinase
MAVRSSASCEDSPSASFAGMFHTELAVKLPDIIDAITKVLSSVLSKRVADYCETQSISQRNIRMTVIIQKMIASRVSGVCFTKQQNMDKALLIEACYGLGEPLVAGRVTPDSYVLSRDTMQLISMSIGYQKEAMILDEQTRTVLYKEIAFHKRNSRKLTWDELKAIAVTCLHVENCLAFNAADIEWTFEESSFYLLQARPYTAFAPNNMTAFQQRKSYI